ncbi:uncharacterized protein LOC110869948 [Helianthus annuus]|uniref:uncharacterized protein LOC110869948 n=1 Tax=Helianthus annuus TaxID=4232 RepID=UPI000B8F1F2B|nr:uncharacterized protein LOC110869948 [Helianthus annuus]
MGSKYREMNKKISAFCAYYNNAHSNRPSEASDETVFAIAMSKYHTKEGSSFTYVGAWEIFKNCPKWSPVPNEVARAKRSKTFESIEHSARDSDVRCYININDEPEFDDEVMEIPELKHPIGRDKAKKEAAAKKKEALTKNESLGEMKVDKLISKFTEFNEIQAARLKLKEKEMKEAADHEDFKLMISHVIWSKSVILFVPTVANKKKKQIIIEKEETSSRRRKRRHCLNRDHEGAHDRLKADYFAENPVYTDEMFRRRFQMSHHLFLHIANDLANYDPFFTLRWDATCKRGFTTLQKCTSAIRQLAYDTSRDMWDEYLKMSKQNFTREFVSFCKGMVKLYSTKYLRRPTKNHIIKFYQAHESKHAFPGMLGSIDCMHWPWRNCPNAWRGQFTRGDHGYPTLILEAVASNDLWVWHAFFGVRGSSNEINVLGQSDVFNDIINSTGPDSRFSISRVEYKHRYYLADGIYPT